MKVKYCINHDNKGTAEFYGGNYAQIYSRIKKYETKGEDIMEDRHSKHKLKECLSNLKKAQRKIVVLEKLINIKKCN